MMLFSRLQRAIRISMDEMWSYVISKRNKVWIITAIVHVNEFLRVRFVAVKRNRDRESLREVIDFLPEADEYHTDGWRGYEGLFEGKGKHVVHIKSKGYVNLNEGLHNLLVFVGRDTLTARVFSGIPLKFSLLCGEKVGYSLIIQMPVSLSLYQRNTG